MSSPNGRLAGRTALVTGAAGGIGSATVRRFVQEGAAVAALDLPARRADLDALGAEVTAEGGRFLPLEADVTDQAGLDAAVATALAEFDVLDVVFANAGVLGHGRVTEVTEEDWHAQLDVNLGGVWRTVKAVAPHVLDRRRGGSLVVTSSSAGLRGAAGAGTYTAAKHGVVGLARVWAHEFADAGWRVNTVHPTAVATDLVLNPENLRRARPDLSDPTPDDVREAWRATKLLDVPWVEPVDVANAVLFLASDEARYVTGTTLTVDAGSTVKWGAVR